ncbi:hypothetical protein [Anabaena sp. CCY 0017]|uniref:hypothetical protein n=1 Tax=Anabaena sp. CCY 0017 TaxID=3103866 RepID=UPI0039C6F0EC
MKPKPPCSGCHGNTYPKPDDDLGGDSPSPIDPYKNPSRGSLGYPSRGSLGYPSRGSFGYPSGVR